MSEQEESLEEKFKRLRDEGLSDPDIVRQVFEENLKTPTKELVKITGMNKLDIGRIKGTVSRLAKLKRAKAKLAPPEEAPTPYKGPVDATYILRSILARHPDIPPKVVEEVLSWADYGFIHPTQLVYLLQSMRGIQSTTANIVAQKYSLALQKAQAEGKMQMMPPLGPGQFQSQWGAFPVTPFSQQQFGLPPQYPGPQQFPPQSQTLTPQGTPSYYPSQFFPPTAQPDVTKAVKEEIGEVKKYVDQKFDEMKPKEEQYVTIEEPLRDPEGMVLLGPNKQPFTRKIRTPVSQATQLTTGDPEERLLSKMQMYKELFKSDITPDEIRRIVKDEVGDKGKEPPITKEDVKESAIEAAKTVLETKAVEDKDERRHQEVIAAIERSGGSRVVEGYKSDSYRFLGQSMDKLATVIEKKEPIKVIIHGARDILAEGPPAKEIEAGAREGIFKHVKPEYVAEA